MRRNSHTYSAHNLQDSYRNRTLETQKSLRFIGAGAAIRTSRPLWQSQLLAEADFVDMGAACACRRFRAKRCAQRERRWADSWACRPPSAAAPFVASRGLRLPPLSLSLSLSVSLFLLCLVRSLRHPITDRVVCCCASRAWADVVDSPWYGINVMGGSCARVGARCGLDSRFPE